MVNLGQLSQSNSYAQISGSGFGTRMLCRPLTEHGDGPTGASMWLTGLRRANALSMNTNDIPNAHMQSPGRFLEFFPGLTDPGDIQFEACWKNDVPGSATVSGSPPVTSGDFQRWQAPKETDDEGNIGFFHSIFYSSLPFEAWVIPPQWTRGLIIVRGYAKMVGPFPHEMEGVINFQGAFKASGKPMMLRGTNLGPSVPATVEVNSRIRWVKMNLLEEQWTNLNETDAAAALVWAETGSAGFMPPTADTGTFYEYLEDEGFGKAF